MPDIEDIASTSPQRVIAWIAPSADYNGKIVVAIDVYIILPDVCVEWEWLCLFTSCSDLVDVFGVVISHEKLVRAWSLTKDLGPCSRWVRF